MTFPLITEDPLIASLLSLSFKNKGITLQIFSEPAQIPESRAYLLDALLYSKSIWKDFAKKKGKDSTVIVLIDPFTEIPDTEKPNCHTFSRNLKDLDTLYSLLVSIEKSRPEPASTKNTNPPTAPEKNEHVSVADAEVGQAPSSDVADFVGSDVHVLLADDSKPIRNFVTKLLQSKNFQVTTFENGQELLDYLHNDMGDLILIDNQMPVLNGIDTLRILKANEKTKSIPVLFLSAIKDKDQIVTALEFGADDYMEKPFNNNEFFARINVHLRIEMLKKQLFQKNRMLESMNEEISFQKEQSDKLLLNTLPKKIVQELKEKGKTEPETFNNVTVYFSDIVGFTKKSSSMEPGNLISELNEIFTEFDSIMERHDCERIKTIGDAYLAVCGMPEPNSEHARNIANAALDIRGYLAQRNAENEIQWEARIGIHTGKVVGGVVGIKKYIYDIFGDTINTASRMESNSLPMKINVSSEIYELLKNEFVFEEREPLEVKGKGTMKMFFLNGPA